MISSPLEKDHISNPELWKLTILLSPDRLDIALYPPIAREQLLWRSFEINPAAESPLRAIEDIIYANPLLFSDFKQVDCLIDNTPAILIPAALSPQQTEKAFVLSIAEPAGVESAEIEIYPTADPSAVVALCQVPEIKAFLQRTFFNIKFHSRLAEIASYLLKNQPPETPNAIYALTREGSLTLIATAGHRLLLANTFRFETETDALYYILAVADRLNLDPATTPVMTSPLPQALTDLLRQHIANIAVIPFPMLRFRTTPQSLQSPFDLIIRPLCE